jgi:hypothetical protein
VTTRRRPPNAFALERRQQVSKALELFSRELLSLKAFSHRNVVPYVGAVLYRADEDEDDIEADGGGRRMLARLAGSARTRYPPLLPTPPNCLGDYWPLWVAIPERGSWRTCMR